MRKITKKIVKKTIAIALVSTMVVNYMGYADNEVKAYMGENEMQAECVDENGDSISISVKSYGDEGFIIQTVNQDSGEKIVFNYFDEVLLKQEYDEKFTFLGYEFYEETEATEYDFTEYDIDNVTASAYKSKVKCILPTMAGNHVWYQIGKSGSDVGYSKIGCKATYRIKNTKKYVDEFQEAVKSCNKNVIASGITSTAAIAAMVALGVLISALTEGVALLIITSITGVAGTGAICIYQAIWDAIDAHNYYDKAKAYGTKL